ncbi:MAG: hypothetical protein ABIO88_01800, partial [Burkholderiaceae bacterium]
LMAEAPTKDDALKTDANSQDETREARQELRDLLIRMHIDRLEALASEAAQHSTPENYKKLKELRDRIKTMKESLIPIA